MNALETKEKLEEIVLILAEDDPDDVLLTKEALEECGIFNPLKVVSDGEELLKLLREDTTVSQVNLKRSLVLLDLNMPRKDGREALREIKTDPTLKAIPVIVLTTSQQAEDISNSYQLGVNSYITKPVSFEGLVSTMQTISSYWLQTVKLHL